MHDLVWMSTDAKAKGCLSLLESSPDAVVLFWFADTRATFAPLVQSKFPNIKLTHAFDVQPHEVFEKNVIFLEHHPMRSKEANSLMDWKASNIYVLSALDEALFQQFGGDKTIELMRKMGMREDEALEHSMISRSIERAQQKLEKKAVSDDAAGSAAEWIRKNVNL